MDMMTWFAWLIVGAVTGWLASIVIQTRIQHRVMLDVLSGVVGAMIGGGMFYRFGIPGATDFNIWSLFVAFTGAVILIGLLRIYIRVMRLTPANSESVR